MLEIEGLNFSRDEEPILRPLDLAVDAGQVLMIRGSNGSGKTTLLKLLCGLLPVTEGRLTIRMDGQPVEPVDPAFRREHMYIGHQLGLKLDLTSLENQNFFAAFFGSDLATPRESLQRVGLEGYAHSVARRLSAGQKKRLSLARLVLNRHRFWLLDEPYSNLDQAGINLVDDLMTEHTRNGGAAIVTSHGTFVPQVPDLKEIIL
ncbi:MAG: heme ABC exporter ATP-binding protein CcmA [Xanthomonadales bacterium]|nr:heme ABC exporter ATP-binding protein CcmA [Xanthomonadales bacterium]